MKITIGSNTENAMNVLGIDSYPFTEIELKTKFRKLIHEHHEDKGGSKEKTQEILEAYKHLKNLAMNSIISEEDTKNELAKQQQENDPFGIYETCIYCKGLGKIALSALKYIKCPDCSSGTHFWEFRGFGVLRKQCSHCNGTGKYKKIDGNIIICKICSGRGEFRQKCSKCNGIGVIENKNYIEYKICMNCKGTGQVRLELWNPVIPKGAIIK